MAGKHSPAPWRITRASDHTGEPEDHGTILSIQAADGTVVLFTDSGFFKPKEPDALLIQAAPQILKALKQMVESHSHGSIREEVLCKHCAPAVEAIRAAEGRG